MGNKLITSALTEIENIEHDPLSTYSILTAYKNYYKSYMVFTV